jgi:hypothetical protein
MNALAQRKQFSKLFSKSMFLAKEPFCYFLAEILVSVTVMNTLGQ